MKKLLNFIVSSFINFWFKHFPPPMVSYFKTSDKARARALRQEDGSYAMQIEGEKEIYPGYPRGHVLEGTFAKMKHEIKNLVFNQAFAKIEEMAKANATDMLPPERMVPAVRHIWETFEKLEDCEIVPDMKGRIRLIKIVLTNLIQEDDAYRFRAQLFLDLIDQKKVRLSKADLYYARGKYWKPDRYKKLFGKVVDGFQY